MIVNERDEVIGFKPDAEKTASDIGRVTGLFIFNSQKEILLSKRVAGKKHDPNKWSIAVCGTVEEGETYLSNIIKEAEEEIGLKVQAADLREDFYGLWESTHRFFYKQYHVEVNLPLSAFVLQTDEVAELRFVPAGEFFDWMEKSPQDFVTSMPKVVPLIRQALGW